MAKKKNLREKIDKLRGKVKDLKDQLDETVEIAVETVTEVAADLSARVQKKTLVSPLAPEAFPTLPVIDGVRFAATAAGVRYAGRTDVMLAHIAPGSTIAGAFTTSSTRAACVLDCQAKLQLDVPEGAGAAILVNSGNANAFTGAQGQASVDAVTGAVANALGLPASRVFSSSTGVIGEPLPHERIVASIATLQAGLTPAGAEDAARAIMTTDTFPKGATTEIQGDGGPIKIVGIAKGSGMIAPNMGTMLVYIFTDAKISAQNLQNLVSRNIGNTFNAITVDSDTSTSDALIVAATGRSAAAAIDALGTDVAQSFEAALTSVMADLAHQVVRDGEGASKFIEVQVTGAATADDAYKVAFAIANSPLVKTACAGEDANWGRVVMAVGKSGAKADRDLLKIAFGDIVVAEKGWRAPDYSEEAASAYMRNKELVISVDLGLGSATKTVWTCDLTHRYIDINADYRS